MQIRVRFQEVVQLRDVPARHVFAFHVHVAERAGDVGVAEHLSIREEHFAADDGVEAVAAVPEGPFPAEVRGGVDGGGGLAVEV